MLTAKEVRNLLRYDAETGEFVWRSKPPINKTANIFNTRWAGKLAGGIDKDGYVTLGINRHHYRAHNLAWLYIHGEWPAELDHINGDRSDNRICNLRLCTRGQNHQNRARANKNSSTGVLGVTFHRASGRYRAEITVNRKAHYLGCFGTAEEASDAYRDAKKRLHTFQPVIRGTE